jgi:hypothetical protein
MARTRTRYYIHLAEHPDAAEVIAANDFADQVEIVAGESFDSESACTVTWYKLGGQLRPRVEVFDEDWSTFEAAADVFAAMAQRCGSAMQPDAFCKMLRELGYRNVTAT